MDRALRQRNAVEVQKRLAQPLHRQQLRHRKIQDQRTDAGPVLNRGAYAVRICGDSPLAAAAAPAPMRPVLGHLKRPGLRQVVNLAGGMELHPLPVEGKAAALAPLREVIDNMVGGGGSLQRAAFMARLAARPAGAALAPALRSRLGKAVARGRPAAVAAVAAEHPLKFTDAFAEQGDLFVALKQLCPQRGNLRRQSGNL